MQLWNLSRTLSRVSKDSGYEITSEVPPTSITALPGLLETKLIGGAMHSG